MSKQQSKREQRKLVSKSLVRLGNAFRWCHNLDSMLKTLENGALRHDEFQQYLRQGNLEKMILGNKMLLRRGDSPELDDWRECKQFGDPELWSRTYIGCFCHERAENVALWWMYGKGLEDAVRVTFSRRAFRSWVNRLNREHSYKVHDLDVVERTTRPSLYRLASPLIVSDVAYATIRKHNPENNPRDETSGKGVLTVSWDGTCRHVKDLDVFVKQRKATGRFKDYEWRFERETRLLIEIETTGEGPDQIVVPFPVNTLANDGRICITAGPWMPEHKFQAMTRRLQALFRLKGLEDGIVRIERSVLSGALNFRK